MKADIEIWKERVMGSLQGIQRAEPGDHVFERIQERISQKAGRIIAMRNIWLAAAGLALLITLNVVGINRLAAVKTVAETERPAQQSPYQLDNANYQLY